MERMHQVQGPHTTDLLSLTDADLVAYFASAGIAVDVAERCGEDSCPACVEQVPARAA